MAIEILLPLFTVVLVTAAIWIKKKERAAVAEVKAIKRKK